ncbi:eukaryotic translation initiation factor 5-like [Sycon ciliatum]|uniref:eukaryotic translation initiation factor 5-like n=1 Tax=Sycon ciliatum TaxID=27933 RepID=UPI0031F6FCB1
MATININTGVADDFYRYKMPKLLAKVEGKGNGIKTVIVNMVDIAKSLHRPPSYSTKYFGCELGAQTQMDAKNERYIVNGSHDAPKLQGLLDGFIKKFVLCAECGNPETNLEVTKKQTINQICIACGHRGIIDMRHKLTTFILKNPPSADGLSASSSTPSKSKTKSKSGKGKRDADSGATASGSVDEEATSPGAMMNGMGGLPSVAAPTEAADEDWSVDTSADAVKIRQTALSMAAASLAVTDDLELSEDDRLERLFSYVEAEKKKKTLVPANRTVYEEAKRLEVLEKGVFIACEILFDETVVKQLQEYRRFLLQFTHGKKKAQKHLLGAIEKLTGKKHPELITRVPLILKTCYDNDLVEEDVFIEWHEKVSKKFVDKKTAQTIREKADMFIKWLKEADEESSEEEEDGVEVVYTHKSQSQVEKEDEEKKKAERIAAGEEEEEEEDDDLDIDNI